MNESPPSKEPASPRDRLTGPEVALVHPPFGPSGLPNLGLALLSAGIKGAGFVAGRTTGTSIWCSRCQDTTSNGGSKSTCT